jgi:(1->4)-alpha-D-glucan 1-alpha-D-glucosylmutase
MDEKPAVRALRDGPMAAPRIPVAAYRLQFNARFRFADARALVPYLEGLGITDLYASPILQAREGSLHGYDVTDPTRLNRELGSEEDFEALVRELAGRRMGLLLDIVPNHMAASGENRWWTDVLASGPSSPFASFFDIDWHPAKKVLERKVLLPILGEPYGRVLENQEIALGLDPGGFFVRCHETRIPLSVRSTNRILAHRLDALEATYGPEHPPVRELWDLISAIEHLPEATPADPAAAGEKQREEERIKERLWGLYCERAEIRAFLDETVRLFNGNKGDPESFGLLDRLLSEQSYWLCFWRLANEEINYRRFFAISDLISLRVEDSRVFDASHALVLRLVREGKVTGLRVDHIDGLYDPFGYLAHLMDRLGREGGGAGPTDFYIVVEKILEKDETLPPEWPVSGTTGYDFLNAVNGLFVSARGTRALDGIYARFLGERADFAETVYMAKKLVAETLFAGEMHALGQHLGRLAEQDRYARDLPRKELREAIVEVTASFPVYRTYIRSDDLAPRDRLYIGRALRDAQRRSTAASAPVFDFLRRVLMLETTPSLTGEQRDAWLRFLMRWQQFTGPIMAKGYEDTALYVYNRLVSLNDVGGDPAGTGQTLASFHQRAAGVAARRPHTINATSTHDTKRSEDVRARINVLSEMPEEWGRRLFRWSRWNAGKKRLVDGRPVPSRNEEILFYQTLLGVWPLDEEEKPALKARLMSYMIKAIREAKVHTRWIRPNPEHEDAVQEFVAAVLDDAGSPFFEDFLAFQEKVAHFGAQNGLAQLLVKIASPGVPDVYQGTELWNFRLVDPDNREPADFPKGIRLLRELDAQEGEDLLPLVREIVSRWRDGRIKLYATSRALRFRRDRRDLFLHGAYVPLEASGGKKEHVLGFARERDGARAVAAVPRLATRLVPPGEFPLGEGAWGTRSGLVLPDDYPERWRNVFTGETLSASRSGGRRLLLLRNLFRSFPVALLAPDPEEPPGGP